MRSTKIIILTEGGRTLGFGHVSRMTSLYRALEKRDIEPVMVVHADHNLRDALRGFRHETADWVADPECLARALSGADAVVIDSYLAASEVLARASSMARLTVCFDDANRLPYPAGMVVNGAINSRRIPYPDIPGVTYLLGPEYLTLREAFWHVPPKVIRPQLSSVLITFGAVDPDNLKARVLSLFVQQFPAMIKHVIVGHWSAGIDDLKALADEHTYFLNSPDAPQMCQAMLDADIAVSAGGQTLCELAKVGTPTLAICIVEHERWNLQGWNDAGFMSLVGRQTDPDILGNLALAVGTLAPRQDRQRRSEIGRTIMAGCGAANVADAVLNALAGLQPAGRDC